MHPAAVYLQTSVMNYLEDIGRTRVTKALATQAFSIWLARKEYKATWWNDAQQAYLRFEGSSSGKK